VIGRFISILTLSTIAVASVSAIFRLPEEAALAVLSLISEMISGVIG
jgi:hypothetical protein